MKFVSLGSCIAGDCVVKNLNRGWRTKNYVSYSPIAILLGEINDVDIPEEILTNETPAQRERIRNDFSGHIFDKIREENADYIIVDLSDFRIAYRIVEFENGKKIFVTNRSLTDETSTKLNKFLENKFNCKIKSERLISFNNISDEELNEYISKYINVLFEHFGKDKIIFFKPKLANQYIDGDKIEFTPNFRIAGNTNVVIDRIYNIAKNYITYIDAPKQVIGDKTCISPFEFHFSTPYYNYLADCFNDILVKQHFDIEYMSARLLQCNIETHRLYNTVFCNQILDRIKTKLDKDIVLIAKTKQFAEMLKERYNKEIFSYIEYNENSDIHQIRTEIVKTKQENDNLIFVLPEIYNHGDNDGIHRIFFDLRRQRNTDYIIPILKETKLVNFEGEYEDIYNNHFIVKTANTIIFEGQANKLYIDVDSKVKYLLLRYGAYFLIGKSCKLGQVMCATLSEGYFVINDKCTASGPGEFVCGIFAKVVIGYDVMFSMYEFVHCGDSHPIFHKKENGKYEIINVSQKNRIIIGNHVWVAYRCHILQGADIGDGSIVGANTFVNKKFPNNVIVAGNPAKIVKKDIAWARSNTCYMLEQDKDVFVNYANETIED